MKPTNSKAYIANWITYIEDCLEVEGCEGRPLPKKLAYAISEFKRVANYPRNLQLFPNTQERLADYLSGLPFHFAYSYSDILDDASTLHECAIPEDKQDTVCEQWFPHCAMMLMRVADKHGLSFH